MTARGVTGAPAVSPGASGAPGLRRGSYIRTASGQRFWPLDARAREVDPKDVAHALSNLCRFTGHVRKFYSVAQHCCYVSKVVLDEAKKLGLSEDESRLLALEGLCHDATEAYLNDLATPVKKQPDLAGYRATEARLWKVIAERFGLPPEESDLVRWADRVMLVTEARDLMPPGDDWSVWGVSPADFTVRPWTPEVARGTWLSSFTWLGGA